MNGQFLQNFSVVTVAHMLAVGALIGVTFFHAYLFRSGSKDSVKEFVVDVLPTSDGAVGEPELPQPDPEPDVAPAPEKDSGPAVRLDPVAPAKLPDKKAADKKSADKSAQDKKTTKSPHKAIEVSKTKVTRSSKGPIKHYNPLSQAEINRLMGMGATAGTYTSIPEESDRCKIVVRNVLHDSWDPPGKADVGNAKTVVRLWFGDGGRITKWEFDQKSGVSLLDDSVQRLLESVRMVPGLSQEFIRAYRFRGFTVDFNAE